MTKQKDDTPDIDSSRDSNHRKAHETHEDEDRRQAAYAHSFSGLCPLCGCILVEIKHHRWVSITETHIFQYTQYCDCCEWESEPYYDQ